VTSAGISPAVVRKAAAFVETLDHLESTLEAYLFAPGQPMRLMIADTEFFVSFDDNGARTIGLPNG
jgi:hypothetical protein